MAHDVVVIGGGPAGYGVAFRAAARGLDVAMVESDRIGGTCLNRGCIPSKAILYVAEVLEQVHRAAELGLRLSFDGLDGEALDRFRASVPDQMRRGLRGLADQRVTYIEGRGQILEPGVVEVTTPDGTTQRLAGRHTVLCTGSEPATLPFVDVDGHVVQTSDQALWFTAPPRRAVIIGAGAIGMEFASMWRPMGADVTVVEALDQPLPMEDPDSSRAIRRAFRRKGIEVLTGAKVAGVELGDGSAGPEGHVTVEVDGEERRLTADVVLVAVGRKPHTAGSGAEELGLLNERGYATTDEWGRTKLEGVWAAGDVIPTLALAHAGFAEGFVVADAIAEQDLVTPVDYAQVPRVTYCHPEVASVGLTEPQAVEHYGPDHIVSASYSLKANAKGIMAGSGGQVKVVARAGGGEVLGVHIVGPHATDLIAEATLATDWGALPSEVAAITHAHPTLYEALGEAFMAVAGVPFHGH